MAAGSDRVGRVGGARAPAKKREHVDLIAKAVRERFEVLRATIGLSAKTLAVMARVSEATLSYWLNGRRGVTCVTATRVMAVLGMAACTLPGEDAEQNASALRVQLAKGPMWKARRRAATGRSASGEGVSEEGGRL